jgi:hypothetical protein
MVMSDTKFSNTIPSSLKPSIVAGETEVLFSHCSFYVLKLRLSTKLVGTYELTYGEIYTFSSSFIKLCHLATW